MNRVIFRRLSSCSFVVCFFIVLLLFAVHPSSKNERTEQATAVLGDRYPFVREAKGGRVPLQAREGSEESVTPRHPQAFLHLLPISKDLIVYSAYFDERARNGHQNVTLFLASVNRTIWKNKWILSCGVGNASTRNFQVRFLQESILMHNWLGEKKFPYDQFAIECYDLPVVNGSNAFIMYRTSDDNQLVVESLAPLIIPAPRAAPSGRFNISVVTCTKAHNKHVAWLPEFIRYQKTLGVDHVHLSILDTFIKDGGFRDHLALDPFIRKAIRDRYLSITIWNNWYKDHEFYVHGSIFQFLDCAYRFRGTYDYVFPLDSDDFFNPSIPGKTELKKYILDQCSSSTTGSCSFRWIFYYPDVCGMKGEVGSDGNVTSKLNPHKGVREQVKSKSLHSTKAIIDFSFHDARCLHCLMPGYKVYPVKQRIAYVAHNRLYMDQSRSEVCQRH